MTVTDGEETAAIRCWDVSSLFWDLHFAVPVAVEVDVGVVCFVDIYGC